MHIYVGKKYHHQTCPRKRPWHRLRLQLNSKATSDGCLQKLRINLWHDSKSNTTAAKKTTNEKQCQRPACNNLLCYWLASYLSILNVCPKLQGFLGQWLAWWISHKNCANRKNSNLCPLQYYLSINVCQSSSMFCSPRLVWRGYLTWAIWNENPA